MTNPLKTDFYEFTMLAAALVDGTADTPCVFSLFTRNIPKGRSYGVVAGTERALQSIKNMSFSEREADVVINGAGILKDSPHAQLLRDYLINYSFKGSVSGIREGDFYFRDTPVFNIYSTFGEAILLETILLSIMNHDSAVASATSRMRVAAQGIPLLEMGSRRAHETAAVQAARSAYIAGATATSNVAAHDIYGIPLFGTSAHAFTLLYDDEKASFRAQVNMLGVGTTLLVDTYDIEQGIRNAVEVTEGKLGAIRIDSGWLSVEVPKARKLLDSLGAPQARIVISGDMDEYEITKLRSVPVDVFGIGTACVTGSGFPTAAMVYKIVQREDADGNYIPVGKVSENKSTIKGARKVERTILNGELVGETLSLAPTYEESTAGTSSLVPMITDGEIVYTYSMQDARDFHTEALKNLSDFMLTLDTDTDRMEFKVIDQGEDK